MLEGLFFILATVALVTGIVSTMTVIRYMWHRHRGTIVTGVPTGRGRHVRFPWSPSDEIEIVATSHDGERVSGWIWDVRDVLLHADSVEVALLTSQGPSDEPRLHLVAAPSLTIARVTGIVTVAAGSTAVLACWASVCG